MAFAKVERESSSFKSFPRGLKDGTIRVRILPGIHSAAEDGSWAKKWNTHTYAVPRDGDPEKKDYYTFQCCEIVEWVNREKVVLETCPECVLIADRKDEFAKLKTKLNEELKSDQRTKDEVRKLLRPHIDWFKRHSRSFWWAVNVMDVDGKFFTMKLPNDAKKIIDAKKKKLKDEEGIGAILPIEQGVWFDITKIPGDQTGTGFPKYEVEIVMERQADGSKKEKLAPLAPEAADEAERSCYDINDPGVITLSREQVKQLAASGDAPQVLAGIFNQSTKTKPTAKPVPAKVEVVVEPEPIVPVVQAPPAVEAPPVTVEEVAQEVAATVESEDDRIEREAMAAIASAQARRAAAKKAALEVAVTPAPAVTAPTPVTPKVVKPEVKKVEVVPNQDESIESFIATYELSED